MFATGPQIRAARTLLGMSQDELASRAMVSVGTLVSIEKGTRKPIKSTLIQVMMVLIGEGIRFVPDDEDTTSTRIGVILER